MAEDKTQELDLSGSSVITDDLANELRTDFLDYAMSVIVARALPDVRDGLKPVHRRILYAMYESGIRPDRPHKKSAWTVGEVIGKYHPHGDSAVYDTMVRLAQDFSMRVPLVDGHGNFGSVDGDAAAAMRYTEARLQKAAMELLRDIDKDTVDYQPNYDESLQEPSVLPSRFPNLLVNGSSGIAVGMATNIPPHNLGEAIDAVKMFLENPDVTTDELMTVLPGPDFPTAAIIMGRNGIKDAYETGKGSIMIRSRAIQEHTTSGRDRIVITEIPYMVNKANMISKIADLVRDKKITEISDLRDESDRNGMRVVIELKKDAIPEVVLNKLYKHTQLQTSFGINMIALVDGTPKQLSLRDILKDYCDYQREVIVRRTKFDLKKAQEREHILEGRVIALDNIDEVIEIIRGSRTDEIARTSLMERFLLTEIQARDILEMRLKRLTGLERENLEAELAEVKSRIAYYKQVLEDDALVRKIIIDEMAEIKEKYATPRKTEISDSSAATLEVEDLIAEEDMVVTITNTGYVKRLPVATYRQQKRGGKGLQGINLKENDYVDEMFIASTHDFVLFFTNHGKVYRLKVHELPVGSRQAKGHAIINLLPFAEGEKIAATISTKSFSKDECLIFATRDGLVKKTTMDLYDRSRRDGIIAIKLRGGDELIEVRRVKKGEKIMMVSSNGKAIKWDESEARAMGRDTTGVKGMTVPAGERVLGMEIAREDSDLLVITERGYGKRTPVDDYPEQHRGGQGVNTITMTPKKGRLVGMKIVTDTEELLISTEEGVLIRTKAKGISKLGRATQGVKIMDVADSDHVTAVARYNEEEAEENRVHKKNDDNQLTLEVEVEDENA
ncbi:MAG: DNA gyrase subunit A [Coriobacteriales bacterium]